MANPPNLFDRDRIRRHHRSGDPRTHLPTAQRIKNQQLGQAQTQPSQEDLNPPRVFRSLALSAAPLENTFSMQLTSGMLTSISVNGVNTLTAISAGPGFPNFDQEKVPQFAFLYDPFRSVGRMEFTTISFAVPLTAFGVATAIPVDHFVLKRNRKYRFDLSHPSLKTIFPQSSGHANPTGYPYWTDDVFSAHTPKVDRSILSDNVESFFHPLVFRPNKINKSSYHHTTNINVDQTHLLGLSTHEGITQVGTPGTPGAYMDLITHEGLPPSLFFTNSAIPDKYDNREFTATGKYLFKQIDGFGPSTGAAGRSPNFRVSIYRDNDDDFKIYPLTYPSYDSTRTTHLTSSYMNMEGRPVAHPSLSAGLDLDYTWLDTRTRTITAFTEKVLSKIDLNGPFNNHPILSSIDVRWNEIMRPGESFNHPPTKAFPWRNQPHHLRNSTVMRDYYNPLIKGNSGPNGSNSDFLSAWNPNWFGYGARDVLDFSGVSNESEGKRSPSHQVIMITPQHCLADDHWGPRPKVGDVVYFLEHNSGKRVSATIIDILARKNKLIEGLGKGWTDVLDPNSIGSRDSYGNFQGVDATVGNRTPEGIKGGMICKLSRNMTLPDPDVEGSDGSIRIYKFPRFKNPMIWFREETTGDHIRATTTDSDIVFLSGYDSFCSVPRISQTGFGALGRYTYDNGDEYTTMKLQVLGNSWVKSLDSALYTPAVSSTMGDVKNRHLNDTSFTDFNLLSSNPILENKANLRLGGRKGNIVGDSGNPGFLLIETKNEPLQMVAYDGTSNNYPSWPGHERRTSTIPGLTDPDGNPLFYFSLHIKDAFKMALSGMEGGNPEGYDLQWLDIT